MGLKVETVFAGGTGSPGYNRLYFAQTEGADPVLEATNAAAAVAALWIATAVMVVDDITWQVQTDVIEFDEATGQPTASYPQGGQFGAFTGNLDPLPWSTQGLIRWNTGVFANGRNIRGHTFMPTATEEWSTVGQPTTQYTTSLKGAAQALIDDADSVLAVYSPPRANPARVGVLRPVTGCSVSDKWAVLRSRRD